MAQRILSVYKMTGLVLRGKLSLRIVRVRAEGHLWTIVRLLTLLYLMHLLLLARNLVA